MPRSQAASFVRDTFTTSRLAEFASEKELTIQTGHAPEDWPRVLPTRNHETRAPG